jgi:peroxiredoxin
MGKPLPEFHLGNWTQGLRGLEELRGRVVLLDFWATWCHPCLANIPRNNALLHELGEQGFMMVGICARNGAEHFERVCTSQIIEYPMAVDERGEAEKELSVLWYPSYYVLDRQGRLQAWRAPHGQAVERVRELLAKED